MTLHVLNPCLRAICMDLCSALLGKSGVYVRMPCDFSAKRLSKISQSVLETVP
jgi:hypothetical protein